MLFVSVLNFQATEQPTRTKKSPICGGTAQLDPKTGVPSRGQRVLLTQRTTLHANIRLASEQAVLANPRRAFGKNLEVIISPSRLDDDSRYFYISSTFSSEIYCQSLIGRADFSFVRLLVRTWPYRPGSFRGRVLWRSHIPHPMLAIPSHAISCTPIPSWSSRKSRNTPSTNQLNVFSSQVGRSVLLNKDYCLTLLPRPKFSGRVGTLGIFSILITNQQLLFVWIP